MSEDISKNEIALWNELVESYDRYALAHRAFFQSPIDRVAIIKWALCKKDLRPAVRAVRIAQYLSQEEHMLLFDEWVHWLTVECCHSPLRDYILALPREWVLERIEQAVEPHLLNADDIDFRRYLELYYDLDHHLALMKLALRALEHQDEQIKEVGREFLSVLEE
jgi:hypothetical protein